MLPLGVGFHEYGSTDIAVAWEPAGPDTGFGVAYRLLRAGLLLSAREGSEEEIDREAYCRIVANLRTAVGGLERARGQHQAAINSINRAVGAVNEVNEGILAGLRRLDELMGI